MDVYGLGTLAMDVLMKVDSLPKEDGFCIVKSSERQPGGSGTNVMVQLARLGAKCGYIGAVGDDDIGKDILSSLESENIAVDTMVVKPGMTSLHTDIVIDDEGNKFIMLNMGNAFGDLRPEEVSLESIRCSDVFYTDMLPGPAAMHAVREAKTHGVITVFNMQAGLQTLEGLGVSREELLNILQYVDVFAPCKEGWTVLADTEDPEEAMKFFRQYCKGVLVFTLGKNGSTAFDGENHRYSVKANKIDAVDTTGAGDSYMGAFIYSYILEKQSLEESMKFASRCAAYTCTGIGARHTPTKEQVRSIQ